MFIRDFSQEKIASILVQLDRRASNHDDVFIKYLDFGTLIVRLICRSPQAASSIEKQLAYVLCDDAPRHDFTLVVWQENSIAALAPELGLASSNPLLERVRRLAKNTDYLVYDNSQSRLQPVLGLNLSSRSASAYDHRTSTYYFAAEDYSPEEFIKQGHAFVRLFNRILKGPQCALVHGAAVALEGEGILFCARGQRGKSTLAVRAMLDGFDYVADDYLTLERDGTGLYAWPIYSIITLGSIMYGDLYDTLQAKFVSNNARKDKYVFNISAYHDRFVRRCPIHLCMFPQIVQDEEPSIVLCNQRGKGRAIVQLVHSTISQMGDKHDISTVKKLVNFLRNLPFYQINLCRDGEKNIHCLREFLLSGHCAQQESLPGMLRSSAVQPTVFV